MQKNFPSVNEQLSFLKQIKEAATGNGERLLLRRQPLPTRQMINGH
jgi:hypothetical protein